MRETHERVVEGPSGGTFCRSMLSAQADARDLIVISGGPGLSWDYLANLDALAEHGFNIHYYDQIGTGRSECRLADGRAPRLSDMLAQLEIVVRSLVADRKYALFAHSAGSAIAIEHAVLAADRVHRLVLASGSASGRDMIGSIQRCVSSLPPELQGAIREGDIASARYRSASEVFFGRFVCRVAPPPPEMMRSLERLAHNSLAYRALWGKDTFHATGELVQWDATARLRRILVPTLVCRGAFDEVDEACVEVLAKNIPGARHHVFERSSHTAHLEEAEEFIAVVHQFASG